MNYCSFGIVIFLRLPGDYTWRIVRHANLKLAEAVADPEFPVGGGAPTPEAATFRKICMSKQKNLDP